jgi:hypothetical protein
VGLAVEHEQVEREHAEDDGTQHDESDEIG